MIRLYFTIGLLAVCLFGCKSGYRKVEPVVPHQANELPKEYRTPKGARVYSDTAPSEQALNLIDAGLDVTIEAAFKPNPKFIPADAPTKWKQYRTHYEYRFMLIDTDTRSTYPTTLDCPILSSFYGTVAGITSGFELKNGKISAVFPLSIMPKLTDTRAECVGLFQDTATNEAEHWVTSQSTEVYLAFTGENDRHPIF